jgi:Rieske Fe-S protein
MAETDMSRRGFVNWFLGTAVGALFVAILYPVTRFLSPPRVAEASASQVEAGLVNDPDFVEKGFKIISLGTEPVIVIRVSPTDFRAFTATCTHLSCIVEYKQAKKLIWCNCHNGEYDLTGKVVAGPPPKPLTEYTVHLVSKSPSQPETVVVARS